MPDPEFEGQTKTRLGNPEVRKIVEGIVSQARPSDPKRRRQRTTSLRHTHTIHVPLFLAWSAAPPLQVSAADFGDDPVALSTNPTWQNVYYRLLDMILPLSQLYHINESAVTFVSSSDGRHPAGRGR